MTLKTTLKDHREQFVYRDFTLSEDKQTANFHFVIYHNEETYELEETLRFPTPLIGTGTMQNALRALHLALGISYYKIFVSPVIEHPYQMDEAEAEFWNDVWVNGLGEFLYVNKLSRDVLAKFAAQDGVRYESDEAPVLEKRALLGIGGGKDSIVAGELLKQIGIELEGFVMATGEQLGQTQSVADTMEIPLNAVERRLDKQLLSLQERPEAFRGHIPISLIFGLVGTALALAKNATYVVVANESSASIPRAEWQGNAVNHQWSKSYEFETKLQKYLHQLVSPSVTYFSAIRPLSSIAIMKLFANMSQYFEVFTSDNSVFRIDPARRPHGRWSLESPKSLSSFILLAPWVDQTDMLRIFGRDFLDEPELEKLFYELIGLEGHQPLDCVGTEEEMVVSLQIIKKQGKFKHSYLLQKAAERHILEDDNTDVILQKLLEPAPEHAIPEHVYTSLHPLFTPRQGLLEQFRGKQVVFVGVGQGRAMAGVQKFLTEKGSILSFEGVDKRPGDTPLEFLNEYDQSTTVFIKNEGIPGHEMPVPYITQLQLFFDEVKAKDSMVVGITGTKGKSTTTALTAHILKSAGRDVVLAGNIGISPLDALDSATKDTIFVLELSSYQLSDLTVSPQISACINLYNDHTDWHGSLEEYWEAKHNIMRFADKDDLFIYNPDFAQLQAWADTANCRTRAIDPNETYHFEDAKLFGDHNRLNVLIAREIARELGIDDATTHRAVVSFEPLRHRMQYVAKKNSLIYIDDAIGMTPESTLASMQAVQEKYGQIGCLLLGGQDREYDFATLLQKIAELQIPNLVLFPDTQEKIKSMLPEGYTPRVLETQDMTEAVTFAAQHSPDNSVVLLSTAAPSYSVWRDFEEKGDLFQSAVTAL